MKHLKHLLTLFFTLLISFQVLAQRDRTITGTVVDAEGEPLPGVAVMIKDTQRGVTTIRDGSYSIQVAQGAILQFSFIGMVTQEVTVLDQATISVTMLDDVAVLDEVVVSAFGQTVKKVSMVGSVQTINPTELTIPSANLSNAFAGRIAGVIAFQRSGRPGENAAEFYIRGISTLNDIVGPLIILDGVEVESTDLDALDPDVIDGFSILKDATATALYGTRGANGVMIVKTKSGLDLDRPQISLRIESFVNTPTQLPKFVDGIRYMEMYNEAVTNQGTGDILFSQAQIENTRLGTNPYIFPNVNWYNEIFKDYSINQRANFNIRGGTSRIVYFMNIGVTHESGMFRERASEYFSYNNNIDNMRYAFQNNIDFHMSPTSTISLKLNTQLNSLRSPNTSVQNIYSYIMQCNPVDFPISFPPDGVNNWIYWGALLGGNDQGARNPMASMTDGYRNRFSSRVLANVEFDQKLDFITEGLRFTTMFSYTYNGSTEVARSQGINRYSLRNYWQNPDGSWDYEIQPFGTSVPTKPVLGTSSSVSGDRRFYYQAYLNYNRRFNDVHNISAMVIGHVDQYDNNTPGSNLINSLPKRKMGFAGRFNYDYNLRYLLEINAGYNGSENFAKGHRWGFFPAIALGWNVSQENFWKPFERIVSNLKLRASYGQTGNDQIGDERFLYQSDINLTGSSSYYFGYSGSRNNLSGPSYLRYENLDITWEVAHKYNAGIDLFLLRSINFTFDAFRERRTNIFQLKNTIPTYLGVGSGNTRTDVYGNFAEVLNRGFDFSINYSKRFRKNWTVHLQGTFTYAHNTVKKYDEGPAIAPNLSQIGRTLRTSLGYVSNGLYLDYADIANNPQSTLGNIAIAPGDIKYVDYPDAEGNYDNRITRDDRVYMGYPTVPEIVYGFGPSIQYKSLDFSLYFQGAARTSLMMSGFQPFGTQYNRNVLQWISDDYWSDSNQNPDARYPRVTKMDNNHNTAASDYWLRDASFLKLKNAEIGYTFKSFRFYISGLNLLTFAPFKHWDPEMGGGSGLAYPTQRTFNIGAQLRLRTN